MNRVYLAKRFLLDRMTRAVAETTSRKTIIAGSTSPVSGLVVSLGAAVLTTIYSEKWRKVICQLILGNCNYDIGCTGIHGFLDHIFYHIIADVGSGIFDLNQLCKGNVGKGHFLCTLGTSKQSAAVSAGTLCAAKPVSMKLPSRA